MEASTEKITAIHLITNEPTHVGDKISVFDTTLDKLLSSGDEIVETLVITSQRTNVTTLRAKNNAMRGGPLDKAAQRNMAFGTCFDDYDKNMLLVQIAANDLHDPVAAEALILRNGYGVKAHAVPVEKPGIELSNKKNETGTVIAQSIAPNTHHKYAIEWAYSLDGGATWIPCWATGVCKREFTSITAGSRILGRRRFIIGSKPPESWVQSSPIYVA